MEKLSNHEKIMALQALNQTLKIMFETDNKEDVIYKTTSSKIEEITKSLEVSHVF